MAEDLSPREFRRMRGEGWRTPGRFSHGLSSYVVIGCALQWYAAADLTFPMMMVVACEIFLYFNVDVSRRHVIPAFSVQAGQVAWYLVALQIGGTVTPLHSQMFPVIICLAGLCYLMAKPGRVPLYLLGAYQVCELVPELVRLAGTPWGTSLSRQLVVSATLRLWAIFLMYQLHRKAVTKNRD